jgi:hypothetical protein
MDCVTTFQIVIILILISRLVLHICDQSFTDRVKITCASVHMTSHMNCIIFPFCRIKESKLSNSRKDLHIRRNIRCYILCNLSSRYKMFSIMLFHVHIYCFSKHSFWLFVWCHLFSSDCTRRICCMKCELI